MRTADLFYIHHGYVGNSMLFWRPNRRGYTVDIDQAGLYTRDELIGLRNDDRPIPFADAQRGVIRTVCSERLHKATQPAATPDGSAER